MATDLATLYIKVESNGVVTASKNLDELTAKSKQAEGATKSLEEKTKKMSLGTKAAYAAIGAAVATFVTQSVKAFMEAETAQMKLLVAMRNQGDYTRQAAEDLQKYADAMQKTTQYENDMLVAQMGTFKSFGMTNDEIKRSIKAAADMATMTGQSVESVSNLLGKAYAGQTQTLARYGVVIDSTVPKSQKFEAVLKQLEQRFGGAAQAQLQTYTGQWQYYKNALNDVMEVVGHGLLKALEGLLVAAGLVGIAFLTMGEKVLHALDFILTPVKALLEGIALIADKLGKVELAANMRGIAGATKDARDNIKAAKNDVMAWTSKQYDLMVATGKTYDVVEKMKNGKRTVYNLDDKDGKTKKGATVQTDAQKAAEQDVLNYAALLKAEADEKKQALKDELTLAGEIKAYRESEIADQQHLLDMAETQGRYHSNTLKERLKLEQDLLKIQQESLAGIDRDNDITGYLTQLKAVRDSMGNIVKLQNEIAEQDPWKGMMKGLKEWGEEASNIGKQLGGVVKGALDDMADGLTELCTNGTFSFKEFADSVIKDIIRMMIKAQMAKLMQTLFGESAGGSSGSGGGLLGAAIGFGSSMLTSFAGGFSGGGTSGLGMGDSGSLDNVSADSLAGFNFHTGGVVGSTAASKLYPASVFAGAQRYHNGLAPDEIPAILQRGETVIPKGQGAGGSLTVNVPINGIDNKQMVAELKDSIESTVVSIVKRHS